MIRISGFLPSSSMMIWVASTIVSIFNEPGGKWFFVSMISKSLTNVVTCSGIVTLGSITTKLSGSFPFVFSKSVVRKISSVLTPRYFRSSVKGFIRMPINGEMVFFFMPVASSLAAAIAVASSSSSGRLPKPSSKSIRKSSTASVCNL